MALGFKKSACGVDMIENAKKRGRVCGKERLVSEPGEGEGISAKTTVHTVICV